MNPTVPSSLRQISTQTQEEPLMEPMPTDSSTASSDSKRPKTLHPTPEPGFVRSRVAQTEAERLEREALRELKRLEREERLARASARRERTTSSTGAAASSSTTLNDSPSVPPEELPIPESIEEDLMSFFHIEASEDGSFLAAAPNKAKNSEFNMKLASSAEKEGFKMSDADEWALDLEVGSGQGSHSQGVSSCQTAVSRAHHHKQNDPKEETYAWRWELQIQITRDRCLHGHQDPDQWHLRDFLSNAIAGVHHPYSSLSPQLSLNLGLKVSFLDIKNAFCQAHKLDRPQGKIYAIPCEGLP